MPDSKPGEAIIESIKSGNALRVTAVDVVTGTEVVFQAPLTTGKAEINRIAIAKLKYVLRKTSQ